MSFSPDVEYKEDRGANLRVCPLLFPLIHPSFSQHPGDGVGVESGGWKGKGGGRMTGGGRGGAGRGEGGKGKKKKEQGRVRWPSCVLAVGSRRLVGVGQV